MFSICAYISSKTLVVRINSHSIGYYMFYLWINSPI